MANVVSKTVTKTAGDLVRTVQETDWKNELSTFGKEVETDAKTFGSSAAGLVEALPIADLHLGKDEQEDSEQAQPRRASSSAGAGGFPSLADAPQVAAVLGSTLTSFGKSLFVGTQELVAEVRETVQGEIEKVAKDSKSRGRGSRAAARLGAVAASAKYSRFDSEVASMQRDSSTYCEEPEDAADYAAWCTTFDLAAAKPEVEKLSRENAFMGELQQRIVPILVEYDTFWTRYFYRLHKLQQKEQQRQALAQRACSTSKDDELGWDDLDDEPEQARQQEQQQKEEKKKPAAKAEKAAVAAKAGKQEQQASKQQASKQQAAGSGVAAAAAVAVAATGATEAAEPAKAEAEAPAAPAAPAATPAAAAAEPAAAEQAAASQEAPAVAATRRTSSDPEPGVDTASDGSGNRDWMLVSNKSSGEAAAPAAAPAAPAPAPAAPAPAQVGTEAKAAAAPAAPAAAAAAAPAAAGHERTASYDSLDFGDDDLEPVPGKGDAAGAGDEEVDEDWGNWD